MKNLHNALQLKHLYLLKQLGYRYTDITPSKLENQTLQLPSSIEELHKVADACHLCELSKSRNRVVFGEGSSSADLMIVGEAPSSSDDSAGKPFTARTGELLTKMIENVLEIPKEQVYITNIVKCKPNNNQTPTVSQVESCHSFLEQQIESIQPKVILALGDEAYRYLSGDDTPLGKIRGVVTQADGYSLVATFHPSYLMRNPSAKRDTMGDLLQVKELLSK